MDRLKIIDEFKIFYTGNEGIESWISNETSPDILAKLCDIENNPLNKVQLNQLIVLGKERGISDGFYKYYWLEEPSTHNYDVKKIPGYDTGNLNVGTINSIGHLKWGMYRIYVDALLHFGNVRYGYKQLCTMKFEQLVEYFKSKRIDTVAIKQRGKAIELEKISKDNRYLISEMACKSFDPIEAGDGLELYMESSWISHEKGGGGKAALKNVLAGSKKVSPNTEAWLFSADDILDEEVSSLEEVKSLYSRARNQFKTARQAAMKNTTLYLSMVNDMDVYVATSMRKRDDFRDMANNCELIFEDDRLKPFELRYFDPTRSSADGHEDKGLIECLMVKCSKVLIYCAGNKESYGKDAEAAMALSLGKFVIFFCDAPKKPFYQNVHPLTRLIQFSTGVATGAIVSDKTYEISELLLRIFDNNMEYSLEKTRNGGLLLKEKMTDSVVRLQTGNKMLSKAFWNYYDSNL